MPRRKISIEEAYAVFEQHGLQVEVKGLQQHEPIVQKDELFEKRRGRKTGFEKLIPSNQASHVGRTNTRIFLHTKQTIATGGTAVYDAHGHLVRVDGQENRQYGPGYCVVLTEIAGELLYQDQLARQADHDLLSGTHKSRVILATADGRSVAHQVSNEYSFDMSSLLGQIGNSSHALRLPF